MTTSRRCGDALSFATAMEDKNRDLIGIAGVSAFPTFQFFKGGVKVDEVRGGNITAVRAKVLELLWL